MSPAARTAKAPSTNGRANGKANGYHPQDAPEAVAPPSSGGGLSALPGALVKSLAGQVAKRIPKADLDERDPDYIRDNLPLFWLASSLYYRGEVRGLGTSPRAAPC